jgi:hypothetical protein
VRACVRVCVRAGVWVRSLMACARQIREMEESHDRAIRLTRERVRQRLQPANAPDEAVLRAQKYADLTRIEASIEGEVHRLSREHTEMMRQVCVWVWVWVCVDVA